jgi:NADH:ubiquinone oxidoreductase subunit K
VGGCDFSFSLLFTYFVIAVSEARVGLSLIIKYFRGSLPGALKP